MLWQFCALLTASDEESEDDNDNDFSASGEVSDDDFQADEGVRSFARLVYLLLHQDTPTRAHLRAKFGNANACG